MINPFKQFNSSMLSLLNKMWNKVDILDRMRGDGLINVQRVGGGITIGLNLQTARRRIAHQSESDSYYTLRRAKCTADAGSGSTITVNLYNAATGIEETTGDESGITVYCNISGGSALNEASRLLAIGSVIFVSRSVYDNAGTPETRWYAVEGFDVTEECECT